MWSFERINNRTRNSFKHWDNWKRWKQTIELKTMVFKIVRWTTSFLTITKNTNLSNGKESHVIDTAKIGEWRDRAIVALSLSSSFFSADELCQDVFDDRSLNHGCQHYLTQLYGLLIKSCVVRYRRWMLIIIMLLLPIIYNIISNIYAKTHMNDGIYKMQMGPLNPQRIFYQANAPMETYFHAAVKSSAKGLVLEQRSDPILSVNQDIRRWFRSMNANTSVRLSFHSRETSRSALHIHRYLFSLWNPSATRRSVYGEDFNIQPCLRLWSDRSCIKCHVQTCCERSNCIDSNDFGLSRGERCPFLTQLGPVDGPFEHCIMLHQSSTSFADSWCVTESNHQWTLPSSIVRMFRLIFYLIFFYTSIFLISEHKDSFFSLLTISGLQ